MLGERYSINVEKSIWLRSSFVMSRLLASSKVNESSVVWNAVASASLTSILAMLGLGLATDDTNLTQVTIQADHDTLLCQRTRQGNVEIATITKADPSEQ